jgi:Flp pilus assembly protein CpaB
MSTPKRFKGAGATLLSLAIVSGLAVTTLAERQYARFSTQEVWAAARELTIGHIVQAADLQRIQVENSSAQLSIADPRAIVGRKLATAKTAGDIINQGDLASPQKLGMTDVVPEGRVAYTLALDAQLLSYSRELRIGDSFDILATSGGRVTTLATDVILLAALLDKAPATTESNEASLLSAAVTVANPNPVGASNLLILAVLPEDVYPLASTLGSEARISIVAYGKNTGDKRRLQVPVPEVPDRRVEVITGPSLEKEYVVVPKTRAPGL